MAKSKSQLNQDREELNGKVIRKPERAWRDQASNIIGNLIDAVGVPGTYIVNPPDGSDTNPAANGYATIQAAIDQSIIDQGHFNPKNIIIVNHSREGEGFYRDPIFIRTRFIHLEALGHPLQTFLSGDSDVFCLVTNLSDTGLADFKSGGGFDFTDGSSYSWDGPDLSTLETDNTLLRSDENDFDRVNMGITIKNIDFIGQNAANSDYGPQPPCVAFLFGQTGAGSTSLQGIKLENSSVFHFNSSGAGMAMFANSVDNPALTNLDLIGPSLLYNCTNLDNLKPNPRPNDSGKFTVFGNNSAGLPPRSNPVIISGFNSPQGVILEAINGAEYNVYNTMKSSNDQFGITARGDVKFGVYGSGARSAGESCEVRANDLSFESTSAFTSSMDGIYFGDVTVASGSLVLQGGVIEGNLTLKPSATLELINVVVKGDVDLQEGSTLNGWKGGSYHGSATDPDSQLGGASAGSYLNV